MEALLAFGAGVLALRLAGALAGRWRSRRAPELLAWSASLLAYGAASGALAWGAAHGWDEPSFRVYYLCGGLLTAALLGAGSVLLTGRSWVVPVTLVYCGLAAGVALAEPLRKPVGGTSIPDAQEHLDFFPARLLAVAGNSLGTLLAVGIALATIRRRPLGNGLIVTGVGVAALGSALAGLGAAESAAFAAVAVVLLYGGFVARPRRATDMRDPVDATARSRSDLLRSTELFADLGEESLERVAAVASELDAPAGAVLINPDTPASGVFVVLEGTVVAETHDGREHELGPGECVGELAVLAGTPRTGRVSARTAVRCLAIERTAFERVLENEPAVARALVRVLARRLVEAQAD